MLLFAAEVYRNHVRTITCRRGIGMIVLGVVVILRAAFLGLYLELQRKVDRRIDETSRRHIEPLEPFGRYSTGCRLRTAKSRNTSLNGSWSAIAMS